MFLIDTHTHLYLPEFDTDRDAVMERAIDNGISKILLPNIDVSTISPMMDMCDRYPEYCFPMMGLHPGSVSPSHQNELEKIKTTFNTTTTPFIAVGEVGIDLYWDQTYIKEQTDVFRTQVQWSLDMDLPLVIHSRDSFDQIYCVLQEFKGASLKGVFHSFTGNLDQAKKVLEIGFYIGINGIITFKNSGLAELVGHIGLDHVLLETDAPYLTPAPHRGKRNESSYLVHIAHKIAELTRSSQDQAIRQTTQNAMDLFKLNHIR